MAQGYSYLCIHTFLHIYWTEVKSLLCIFLWNLRYCSWHCVWILSRVQSVPLFTHFNKFCSNCRRSLSDFLRIGRFISNWWNRVTRPYLDAPPPLHMTGGKLNEFRFMTAFSFNVCVCVCVCVCVNMWISSFICHFVLGSVECYYMPSITQTYINWM
jgi:hypothetical protein